MADLSLTYNDHQINERGEMLSLTDMWRAAGRPANQRPVDWLDLASTKTFADHIGSVVGKSHHDVIQRLKGNDAGTWAHWQIGMAYAKYLSPEFHAWCNDIVRTHMERRGAPVETVPAVIARDDSLGAALKTALEPLVQMFADATRETHGRLSHVETDVSHIKHEVACLRSEVRDLSTKGRRRIKDTTKGQLVRDTDRLGGRCPCCGVAVVTEDGRHLPHAEFDHFYANSAPDADHCWLICASCHAELTRNVAKRDERNAEFQAFQAKRRRLPGVQLALIDAAA